ncbi:hypothetical protein [Paenibacillus sp. MBLB4367]|uniref:hypothetical protein n=1 Tax=Paenibacillus sp. MBLB4367 TaxID=3384767 RepID=UPI003907F52A
MRDLLKDKAICEAATGGLEGEGKVVFTLYREQEEISGNIAVFKKEADAEFMVHARTGWPEAIDRAIAAEKENAILREALDGAEMSTADAIAERNDLQKENAILRQRIADRIIAAINDIDCDHPQTARLILQKLLVQIHWDGEETKG